MYPVLFSIGSLSISSFGLFLTLGFLMAAFIVWRLARIYDLNEEKMLDLAILVFLGGLLGARIYFVITHWGLFEDVGKAILVNRYPGLSFWGGFAGGIIALKIFAERNKLNFWQVADFAAVGFILGLAFGDLGCFLGGCGYGVVSNSPLAIGVVGLVGKRFPVSLLEGFIFILAFVYLWRQAVKFHFAGKIASLSLLILGIVKFSLEYFRGDKGPPLPFVPGFFYHQLWAVLLLTLGIVIFYYRSKRKFLADILAIVVLFGSSKKREILLLKARRNWYNYRVRWKIGSGKAMAFLRSLPKAARKKLNVKPTPTKLG